MEERARPLIRLLRDLVVVLPDGPRETWNLGDVVIHKHPKYQRSPQRGTVLGTGPTVSDLQEGDRVLYGRTAWVAMLEYGLVFHERDILCRIEE